MKPTSAARPAAGIPALFVIGGALLGGAAVAGSTIWIATLWMMAHLGHPSPLPTLPAKAYAGIPFPAAAVPSAFDGTLMFVFLSLAGLGLLCLAAAVMLRVPRTPAVWLIVPGALVSLAGVIGAIVARRAADIASFVASHEYSRLVSDPSNPIGLAFDPASAHHVGANYTGFWTGMLVVAVGLLVVLAGVVTAFVKRRHRVAGSA